MATVNQERLSVSRSNDELARRKLEVQSAENEISVADAQERAAKAQLDANRQAEKSAQFDRNDAERSRVTERRTSFQKAADVAQAHQQAARARLTFAQRHQAEGQAQLDLAQANLEKAKFMALQKSGDPASRQLAVGRFEDRVREAQARLDTAQQESRTAESAFSLAQNRWTGMGGRAAPERATGGSGNTK